MGVSRQYIYKLVKEDKLRASRISSRMSFIRRTDIELLLKSKPYERVMSKVEFDIAEYYTAEEIAEKYKVNTKWVWTYTREHNVPKVKSVSSTITAKSILMLLLPNTRQIMI